ncbi:hypothetical protein NDU88_000176 [Pleurodeles waltl]|uniref:Uncharacterized protein n=1 Tax=Pleurodeles waltl TaxID=8319 RepID=A0AAV7LWN3_PLEWA|nr:hypothetical protein NDU88_000176 [Pleurodeles waltl]
MRSGWALRGSGWPQEDGFLAPQMQELRPDPLVMVTDADEKRVGSVRFWVVSGGWIHSSRDLFTPRCNSQGLRRSDEKRVGSAGFWVASGGWIPCSPDAGAEARSSGDGNRCRREAGGLCAVLGGLRRMDSFFQGPLHSKM